jgi:hypothetical protein
MHQVPVLHHVSGGVPEVLAGHVLGERRCSSQGAPADRKGRRGLEVPTFGRRRLIDTATRSPTSVEPNASSIVAR